MFLHFDLIQLTTNKLQDAKKHAIGLVVENRPGDRALIAAKVGWTRSRIFGLVVDGDSRF